MLILIGLRPCTVSTFTSISPVTNHKLLFRKEYMPYYMVTLAYGCQKRIRIVFAPWVIIELLRQGADVIALLTIVESFKIFLECEPCCKGVCTNGKEL